MNVTVIVTIEEHTCGECGLVFGLDRAFRKRRQDDGQTFYCPNGHPRVYRQTEAMRLKAALDQAQADAAFNRRRRLEAEAEARHQAAVARGHKGAAVKAKKRSAAGVCPAPGCKRSFANVARHVVTCHPDLKPEDG